MKNNELNNKEMEKVNGGLYWFREGPVIDAPKTNGQAADGGADISNIPAFKPKRKLVPVTNDTSGKKFDRYDYI